MKVAVLDYFVKLLSDGKRCFEIKLQRCATHEQGCYPWTYDDLSFNKSITKEEFRMLLFEPILYFWLHEKIRCSKRPHVDYDRDNLNGFVMTKSTRFTSRNLLTKDPQRMLDKTWITIQFGLDVFRFKHPYEKTFLVSDFCNLVETNNIFSKLSFETDDQCLSYFNEQVKQFFLQCVQIK